MEVIGEAWLYFSNILQLLSYGYVEDPIWRWKQPSSLHELGCTYFVVTFWYLSNFLYSDRSQLFFWELEMENLRTSVLKKPMKVYLTFSTADLIKGMNSFGLLLHIKSTG